MAQRGNILLVSGNPEAHRTLELIASTYSFEIIGSEDVKTGVNLIGSLEPDCVIFDFDLLANQRQRVKAKKKLEETGIPILFLNNGNGVHPKAGGSATLELEPMVKFVVGVRDKLNKRSHGGFLSRFHFLSKLRRT